MSDIYQDPSVSLQQQIQQVVYGILADPLNLPAEFKGWMPSYLEANPPTLPISQITGFTQFAANFASTAAHESTTSQTYADLATVGPRLLNLPDGKYIILFGSWVAATTAGQVAYMAVQANATPVPDDNGSVIAPANAVFMSQAKAFTTTLSNNGNNSLTAKYRTSLNTSPADFQNRWLIALKYANL